jgi:MFS family permease
VSAASWVAGINFFLNFTFGALLPILPVLSLEASGQAFTAFLLMKALWFVPAGLLCDRIGARRGLEVALVCQCIALATLRAWPELPAAGRVFEGLGLAQGTLAAMALLSAAAPTPAAFERDVGRIMLAGSLGSLLGPFLGFWGRTSHAPQVLTGLLAASTCLLVAQRFLVGRLRRGVDEDTAAVVRLDSAVDLGELRRFLRTALVTVLGFAAAKAIALGWEPLLALWAADALALSPAGAGASFVVSAVGFAAGAALPKRMRVVAPLIVPAYACLEIALQGGPWSLWAWWSGMALAGFWFGQYVTWAMAALGFGSSSMLSTRNALWLAISDLPAALAPAVLWRWRAADAATPRIVLAGTLALVACVGVYTTGAAASARRATS